MRGTTEMNEQGIVRNLSFCVVLGLSVTLLVFLKSIEFSVQVGYRLTRYSAQPAFPVVPVAPQVTSLFTPATPHKPGQTPSPRSAPLCSHNA